MMKGMSCKPVLDNSRHLDCMNRYWKLAAGMFLTTEHLSASWGISENVKRNCKSVLKNSGTLSCFPTAYGQFLPNGDTQHAKYNDTEECKIQQRN